VTPGASATPGAPETPGAPATRLLELREVAVTYQRREAPPVLAVAGVDLEVERGQVVGLVGETGCGKSSLARAAVGLVRPSGGQVLFDGRPVVPLGRRARPRDQVRLQMVFQDPYSSLNPRRRVGEQVADGLAARGRVGSSGRRMGRVAPGSLNPRGARVGELLERVGLPVDAAERFPHEFSGGQRQRIAIARALAPDPALIVADEPISALDASAQAQIANLLVALARDLGMGLLFISHDLAIVRQVADVVAVMYLGKVVEVGPTAELWRTPAHPYSEALIGAVPPPDGSGRLPTDLPGEVPDPSRPPSGCRFRPRCPHAFDRCGQEPPLLALRGGRQAACWLQSEGGRPERPSALAGRVRA
jgi:peptide/nickel transport system ATP-binding protein